MIPLTSQGFYEIAWAARSAVVENLIANCEGGLFEVLDNFCAFDFGHTLVAERVWGADDDTGKMSRYLTGKFSFKPIPGTGGTNDIGTFISEQYERMAVIADLVEPDTQAIVELGCGWGINLFRLMRLLEGRTVRWIGAEYTQSGRSLCEKLAGLEGSQPLEVAFVDHMAPDLGFLAGIKKALIFTSHSIEQVETIPDDYFSVLAHSVPSVRGIHLEPFGFQAEPSTGQSRRHRDFMEDNGWNRNFFPTLKAAEENGDIRIQQVEIAKYHTDPNNPTSLAVWEKMA